MEVLADEVVIGLFQLLVVGEDQVEETEVWMDDAGKGVLHIDEEVVIAFQEDVLGDRAGDDVEVVEEVEEDVL